MISVITGTHLTHSLFSLMTRKLRWRLFSIMTLYSSEPSSKTCLIQPKLHNNTTHQLIIHNKSKTNHIIPQR